MTLRIMYGVQGTGNGHITRARVMAEAFAARQGIQVDYLFSGREPSGYFDMEIFGDYQTRTGLTFVHQYGAVSRSKTLLHARPLTFLNDVNELNLSGYDLVLNDFEPVTAWAARRQGVPSFSISHQAAFSYPVPTAGQSMLDRLVLKHFAPTDKQLGVHWYHFGHTIMPPFIENAVSGVGSSHHFLVYLPFEHPEDIRTMLGCLSEYRFEIYHPGVQQDNNEGHLKWRKICKAGFHQSLRSCSGVIANGGFELSSECLQLGRKLLIKPLHGQFEQLSNARTLQMLNLCQVMLHLDVEAVESFVTMAAPEPVLFPHDPGALTDWLVSRNWHNPEPLIQYLWQQVRFPEPVRRRLKQIEGS